MKKLLLCFGFLIYTFAINAQIVLLTGKPIGTPSVDYSTGEVSTDVNTPADVFDDNVNTFYASYQRSNGWVGLDLGQKHIITRISYRPRTNQSKRLLLGVFEGANEPDFSDAIPLYMIQTTPQENQYGNRIINCSRGFRYIRYVGPNDSRCNIADIKFYGKPGDGDDSQLYQITNLPLLTIHTKDQADVTSKEVYTDGIISIISEDGKAFFTDTLRIRGRGNASWSYPKKPYKIKLNHKKHLLGMPAKDKTWTLINNYGDKTLIRNLVAFEISRRMKMDYTPASRLVNLMLNGEFKGCYQLTDQLEVGKNRIDITQMDSTCNSGLELSGGYLIEVDAYATNGESKYFISNNGTPVTIKYPDSDKITDNQVNYIRNRFNLMEDATNSSYYTDSRLGYARTLDIDAFLKYFLIGELDGNTDTYWSVYMTKDRGLSEKFKCASVWDVDLGFENDKRTYPINDLTTYLAFSNKSSSAGKMRTFVQRVVLTQQTRVKELWNEARNKNGLTAENINAFIDSLALEIDASQKLNFIRWPILNQLIQQNFQALGDYQAEVDFMKQFVINRFEWLDHKIGYEAIPEAISTIEQTNGSVWGENGYIAFNNWPNNSQFTIYTIDGNLLKKAIITSSATTIAIKPGIYIVNVESFNNKLKKFKIVVK